MRIRKKKSTPARRTTLTEAEWALGELLITPDEECATLYWTRGTYVSHLGLLYKACCVIGEYRSVETANAVADQLSIGNRMKSDDTRPSRVWPPFKKGEGDGKKATSRKSCLRSADNI